MPTMIPVQVTQTQEEADNPTMALPIWRNDLVARIPVTNMTQKTLNFGKKKPTHDFRPVREHMRKLRIKKKESKSKNYKNDKEKVKHGAFPKMDVDGSDKEDLMFARSLYLKEKLDLARGIQN